MENVQLQRNIYKPNDPLSGKVVKVLSKHKALEVYVPDTDESYIVAENSISNVVTDLDVIRLGQEMELHVNHVGLVVSARMIFKKPELTLVQ